VNTTLKGGKAFSYIDVELAPGERIIAESDAMSSMDARLDLNAHFNGGIIKGLSRKYLGGESLFISHFSNPTSSPCKLTLVQPTPGEILCKELNNDIYGLVLMVPYLKKRLMVNSLLIPVIWWVTSRHYVYIYN
jgi:uncharacterized protein (AIM24 family)